MSKIALYQGTEGDLIAGSGNSSIATLAEPKSRFVMLAKVGNKDSHSVVQALIKQARKLQKGTLPFTDMGPWNGNVRPPKLHAIHRH